MIDLHTHSDASDGTDSPTQLVKKAAAKGITTLALTDHDTIDGLNEAMAQASAQGINFIRGCEISTKTHLGEVHILGLWLPENDPDLEKYLNMLRKARHRRNDDLLKKLQALGMDIDWPDFPITGGCIGRPHIAKAMLDKGYVKSIQEAFTKFLGEKGAAFVPHPSPPPEEAVGLLASSGATVVFAHPLLQNWPLDEVEAMVARLAKKGLGALEAWHSAHSIQQAQYLEKMAAKYNLAVSGGSDYHGLAKPRITLGIGAANQPVPDRALDSLLARRRAMNLPI